MRHFKFLSIMLVISILCISFSVAGTQIPISPGEKLKNNYSTKINYPLIINKFDGVFRYIINHFINIIPTFFMKIFNFKNIVEVEFENKINELNKVNKPEQVNVVNNRDQITVINNEDEVIVDIDYKKDVIIENNKDIVETENTKEEFNNDEEKQQEINQLELTLELEELYEYGKPIPVKAILTNNGEDIIFLCEMDVKLRTLDFEIETPDCTIIHYIGPFEGKAQAVRLDPYQSIFSEINLTSSNVTFGEKEPDPGGVSSPYKFLPGDYTIKGIYISYQTLTVESANFWKGELFSPIYKFSIKPGPNWS